MRVSWYGTMAWRADAVDMGTNFGIEKGGVLTLFIAAPPNGSSVWVRVVDEV
jgi:hypothetical protein